MTQADKELLLQDLCARLPYRPILNWKFIDNSSKDEELKELSDLYIWWITKAQDCEVKPYLRPMSSMTEEEKRQYGELCDEDIYALTYVQIVHPGLKYKTSCHRSIDWLNKKMFDYRGLIPMGLALEAPKDMY